MTLPSGNDAVSTIRELQHSVGNAAVARMIERRGSAPPRARGALQRIPLHRHISARPGTVTSLGREAVDALRPLLDDLRSAPLFGSQDATTSAAYGNRVRDYAFVLIAEILGVPYEYDESPEERDRRIDALAA